MYMVILVLDDPNLLETVIDAWEETGVGGITILPSTGMARVRNRGAWRDDLPLFPSLADLSGISESFNRTLFTIVSDEVSVDRVFAATSAITGSLDTPNSGIMFALPVSKSVGIRTSKI